MTQQTVNIGSVANDGTGDTLRAAFDKLNDNDTELYSHVATNTAGIAAKADSTEVDDALALKADADDVVTALALKANSSDVATSLALKADQTDLTSGLATKADASSTTSALALKAPLASPTFTGAPVAPTAADGTNTTQLATTAFVRAAITALINSSPAALDTLKELADALGDDPNFAATVNAAIAAKADAAATTSALALKAPVGSPTLTGTPAAPTAAALTNTTQIATTAFVTAADAALALLPNNDQTASYVAVLADAGRATRMTVAGANTYTIPPNSSVAFSIGSILPVEQWGAGTTTVAAGVGVTIRSRGGLLALAGQYAAATIRKVATDEWLAAGDFA